MISPRNYQTEIVMTAIEHFDENDKGVIVMPCGSGKTFTSLFIAKEMGATSMVIFAPTIILVKQWMLNAKKVFEDMIIGTQWNDECDILITTYHNAHKIAKNNIGFDLSILDECHHVSADSSHSEKSFSHSLHVNAIKQLAITATFRTTKEGHPIHNDNIEYFGDVIVSKSIEWAITNKIITDYEVHLCLFNIERSSNSPALTRYPNRIYVSVMLALQYIASGISSHVLIYANRIDKCEMIVKCISDVLKTCKRDNFVCFAHTSNSKSNLKEFMESQYGIVTSVYSLGEGFDMPRLDTVIFSEYMSAEIRICQSAMRSCRLHESKLLSKVILPIQCKEDKTLTKNDFKKVQKMVSVMLDENVEYTKSKFRVLDYIPSDVPDGAQLFIYDMQSTELVIDNILSSKNDFKN